MIMKGQKINDRYQIIKTIGEGGMANVYLAYDTILDRNVAVKVLRGDLATDEKFVRRFQREALSASSLSHPNIVEVYDVGEDNGSYYIVMEYIEGKHLKQLLKKRGNLTLTEVVDVMLQVTDGMSAAHDSYIIHRDIKPQNIMILENGLIKITDFGIAMALNSTQLTQTNSVMGSVHYLPPEQASGKGATIQSDVYSMGILMYELLTGTLPFRGDNAVEIALKHIKEPFPTVRDKVNNLPQSIENIIMRATAKNVKNRYADAKEMHDDLKTALSDSRASEPKFMFKYPEDESDSGKRKKENIEAELIKENEPKTKKETEKKKTKNKEAVKKEETGEIDIKAKQITERDLKKKENKLLLILAVIFTAIVVIVTTLVLLVPKFTKVKSYEVPDVSNLTVLEAEAKLQEMGFEIDEEQKEISSSDIESGRVVKTSPQAGSKRKEGAIITLYVSSGENGYVVEDLVGQNATEVKAVLERMYNLYVILKEEDNDKANANEIIRTEPAAGATLTEGDTITLYIPNKIGDYPDFTTGEYSLKDIQSWCEKYSITLDITYNPTDEYPAGTIYEQSQKAGTTAMPNQNLVIYIAEELSQDDPAPEDIDATDNDEVE
ncbi:MAG: Stk1 family PASTA domain-containing Ser/Thr kinase [Bacilli bacterium]|jgi:serine/threonine protein kinase|nr:Stk1 family PASTA domain-containing Ser/Thr kinase [Bacilli bacterium]